MREAAVVSQPNPLQRLATGLVVSEERYSVHGGTAAAITTQRYRETASTDVGLRIGPRLEMGAFEEQPALGEEAMAARICVVLSEQPIEQRLIADE